MICSAVYPYLDSSICNRSSFDSSFLFSLFFLMILDSYLNVVIRMNARLSGFSIFFVLPVCILIRSGLTVVQRRNSLFHYFVAVSISQMTSVFPLIFSVTMIPNKVLPAPIYSSVSPVYL